jgi:hypothetical protein
MDDIAVPGIQYKDDYWAGDSVDLGPNRCHVVTTRHFWQPIADS